MKFKLYFDDIIGQYDISLIQNTFVKQEEIPWVPFEIIFIFN